MNSGSELREDLNTDNVLGSGGKLALQFAALTRKLWSGKEYSINPSMLKVPYNNITCLRIVRSESCL